MKKNKITIKKIVLEDFLGMLMEVYDGGIDVIDMIIEKGNHQDTIMIINSEEEHIEKEEADNKVDSTIDFNELI